MALTQEQFEKARESGFSVEQIITFEKQRNSAISTKNDEYARKFIPQFTEELYKYTPSGKKVVSMLPHAKEIEERIAQTPPAEGFMGKAGEFVGRNINALAMSSFGGMAPGGAIPQAAAAMAAFQAQQAPAQGKSIPEEAAWGALTGATLGTIGKGISKVKLYTDKLVTNTAKSMIAKVQNKIEPLRKMYKSILEPFANQTVGADEFEKALSSVPKSIRNDFIEEYASKITNAKGKPMTTVGNLHRMELELKDFVKQPKFGEKISAADFNVAEAAKKLKEIRLAQLPNEAHQAIRALDKQFGKVVEKSDYILPKLVDKNGAINTKYLFRIFNNPAEAGSREFIKELKNIDIDLSQETKIINGWIRRQALKKGISKIGERASEGAIIGGILRGGM